jgi:hypothetical protein
VRSSLTEPVLQLAAQWRAATGAARRRIAAASVGLVWILALLLARHGTARARLAAAIVMGLAVTLAVAWLVVQRRLLRHPAGIVRRLARAVEPERADRALRALSLVGPDGEARGEGTSPELARLHIERALAQLPSDRVVLRAASVAGRLGVAAIAVGICAAGVALANAWSVLEGADVLVARGGVAPVPMRWLGDVEIAARPPDYLHDSEVREVAFTALRLPYGTVVTVRGVALHPGRTLLLSDGTTDVPFVEDGAGEVLARWPLAQTTGLRVVARFGPVVVPESEELSLDSIPDEAPVVKLDGAPRQVMLVDQSEDLPIRYEASDDHGLREVHLVLRSGVREERRVLSRLDGDTRGDQGGQVLRLRDAFLRASHVPVSVTVEAKDNDPLTGPKWGKSAALFLVPPDVGEPEARRLDSLRAVRDALVDTLAWRLSTDLPAEPAARKALLDEERARTDADERKLSAAVARDYAGARVARRLAALLSAQAQKTRKATLREIAAPSQAAHAGVVKATERFVLVVDAVIRGLGFHDARDSAKALADVADDLAGGASQMQREDDAGARAEMRIDAAALVLTGGGRVMKRLGALGRDLGEIIGSDLLRVGRARGNADWSHAELAARDLAVRLREPDPSFGARGRSARGGGESGGGRGTPGEEGEGSGDEVDRAEQEAAQDLERLAQDHAGEMAAIEQALAGATSESDMKALRDEAKQHAEAVREAVRELPTVGMGSDSWTSKGSASRELAEQMARSLEQGRADDAVQSGRSSLGSLDEARKILQAQGGAPARALDRYGRGYQEDPTGAEVKRIDEAKRKLEAEEKWAEEALRRMRQLAAEKARKQLEQGGDEEGRLAERARELGQRARSHGALPDKAVESIGDAERAAREAAQLLKQGEGDKGLERQREAQRDLERAGQELGSEEEESGDGTEAGRADDSSRGTPRTGRAPVPGSKAHQGPDDFRQRVVRGLGQPSSGSLKDAVHRYAEGLLR